MPIYKTAEYKVKADAIQKVEAAMQVHAAKLKEKFPGFLWWTVKSQSEPNQYLTVIVAPDDSTNEAASDSPGTAEFVDALYPNVDGEVKWTDWELVGKTYTIP